MFVPKWIIDDLGLTYHNFVVVTQEKLKTITLVKISCPYKFEDPLTILEFELRNRQILTVGDKIDIKIFELLVQPEIVEIYSNDEKIQSGSLYDSSISRNVFFEIC